MVIGFKNSPQILQRVMNTIFEDFIGKGIEIYMDDIVVHAKTKRRHDELVLEVMKKFKRNNMKINWINVDIPPGKIRKKNICLCKNNEER